MTVSGWLKARFVELGASLCTAGLLVGGVVVGVPFLRERIPQTLLYCFCCVAAVLLRAVIDLAAHGSALMVRTIRPGSTLGARLEQSRA